MIYPLTPGGTRSGNLTPIPTFTHQGGRPFLNRGNRVSVNSGFIRVQIMATPLRSIGLACAILLLLAMGACSPGETRVNAIVVSSDLAVGANRVAFGLVDLENMPVRTPEAQVQPVYFATSESEGEARQPVTAAFSPWPLPGGQGVFVAHINFDVAGPGTVTNPAVWELRFTTTTEDGKAVVASALISVKDAPSTPAIGAPAPASVTPKASEVDDLATITTANPPDPELYELSIHEALADDKPLVVTFSTPAFCVSATCGPQVKVISELKERFKDRANFIHVEVFEDPHLIEGGRPSGGLVPSVEEWGLPTEPWTFVVDKEGRVRAKFEQFTSPEELEAALQKTL